MIKDLHCHLLYGIDDGSRSIEESIALLKEMENEGISECILTPHYIEESDYQCNNKDKKVLFKKLIKKAKEENISIKMYLGNEAFITANFIELIKKEEIQTLNKSKYLLFEFPMRHIYNNTSIIINELVSNGYIPILAHPERYYVFQRHPELLEEYLRTGLLLQGNFTSLFGKYGKKAAKTLKLLLKKKWITFLGSDTHHDIKFNSKKLEKKLLRITKDKEYVENLLYKNFDRVINDEEIGMLR